MHIGYHETTSNGFLAMGKEAVSVGGDTFAFFTRNPRGGKAKEIDKADADALNAYMKENNFAKLVAHAPYTMNPCSANPDLRKFAYEMMLDDFARLEYTPGAYYNFHPGSHTGQGSEVGVTETAQMIADVFTMVHGAAGHEKKQCSTILLIETMAGKGSEIGRTFEEIASIIAQAEEKYGESCEDKLGVCLDTCHIWDGGYDIVNDLDGVMTHFDKTIGLNRLKAFHINDSLNDREAHKDRHAKIGEGHIGLEAFGRIVNHPAFKGKPFILETPNEHDGYKHEIEILRAMEK